MAGRVRIGAILVRMAVVTEGQLEEALGLQVVRGGRLGTNLVDRFGIDLDRLADALARQHGIPCAHQVHFENADQEIVRRLPPEIAHQWNAVPLGHVEGLAPDCVAVAVMDPPSGFAEDELCTGLGAPIVAAVAPELRVHYYLEKLYGKARANRFKRVPTAIVTGATLPDPDAAPGAHRGEDRRSYVTTVDRLESDAEEAVVARIEVRRADAELEPAPARGERAPAVDLSSLDDTLRAIRRATGRDSIGDIVVSAMRDGFGGGLDAGVIMIVRDEVAVGWKGFVRGGIDEAAEELAVPLSLPSRLSEACEERRPFFGPPPEGARIEPRIWQLLCTPAAASVGVVPVFLLGELVCLIYAQAHQPGGLEGACPEGLTALGNAVSAGFERLARAAQR